MVLDSGERDHHDLVHEKEVKTWYEDFIPGEISLTEAFFFFSNIMCAALTLYVHTNCWSVPIVCIGMAFYRPMIMYRRHRCCIKLSILSRICFSVSSMIEWWNKSPFSLYLPPREAKVFDVLFASTSSLKMHGKYYSICSAREVPTRILPSHVLPFTRKALFRKANRSNQVHTLFHLSDELSNCATIHELPMSTGSPRYIHPYLPNPRIYRTHILRLSPLPFLTF